MRSQADVLRDLAKVVSGVWGKAELARQALELANDINDLQRDAERWRAVARVLTVRNQVTAISNAGAALQAALHPDHLEHAFVRDRVWLESKEPLEGVALTVEQFADALRHKQES